MTANRRIAFPANIEAIAALVPVDSAPSAMYLMNRNIGRAINENHLKQLSQHKSIGTAVLNIERTASLNLPSFVAPYSPMMSGTPASWTRSK